MVDAGPTAPETVRLFFRRPPFWSGSLTWGVVGSWLGLYLLYGMRAATADMVAIVTGVALALLPFLLVGWRFVSRPRSVPPIELSATHMSLPLNAESSRTVSARYADLRSLSLRQRGQRQFLVIETAEGAFIYPALAFADANAIERFLHAMRERLTSMPGGMEILRGMAQRDELMRAAIDERPTVTYALMAAIAAGFLVQILGMRALNDSLDIARFGGNVPALVRGGEWWRLVTASFLHGDFFHIFINGISLISLGALLERVLGPWRLLFVYLVSGIGGAAASGFLGDASVSVGASTAIFGLFGALVTCNAYYRRDLPIVFRQPWSLLLFFVALNTVLPVALPWIDWRAHVGGFVTGLVVTVPLLGSRSFVFDRPTHVFVKVLTIAVVAVHVVALGVGVTHALDNSEAAQMARLEGLATSDPDGLNATAWYTATDPQADPSRLRLALTLIERALAMRPGDWQMLDTRATVLYRLQRYDEALEDSAAALRAQEADPNPKLRVLPEIATQLARFLEARTRKSGTRFDGGATAGSVRLSLASGPQRAVVAEIAGLEAPQGVIVYAVARHSGKRVGFVRMRLGATRLQESRHSFTDVDGSILKEGTELTIHWIDARDCACTPDTSELKAWPNDPSIDMYP